jgi:hypothetical protein
MRQDTMGAAYIALFQRWREHSHLIPRSAAAVPVGRKFSDLVGEFASSCGAYADGFAKIVADTARMRLSTWLIIGLSAAYAVDMYYYGGAYSMAVVSLFRHVGMGVLAGLSYYV